MRIIDLKNRGEGFKLRVAGIDLLRGIAAFGIVGCHLSLSPRTAGGAWVTCLCDFNVGVFAAVAGFLMAKAKSGARGGETFHDYVWKRVKRLLPTYFFWSVVFIVATSAFDLILDGGHLNPKYGTCAYWLRVIFLGDAATHLWFLACLLYAQILLQAFSTLPVGGGVWILLGLALIVPVDLVGNWFCLYPLRLFAFLVTGYGLGRLDIKLSPFVSGGLTVLGLSTYVLLGGMVPAFISGWVVTIPLLLFFTSLSSNGRVASVAGVLGSTSMGVYLVHPLITRALSVVWVRIFSTPFGVLPVLSEWLLAWAVAFVAAFVLLRLPVINRFVR